MANHVSSYVKIVTPLRNVTSHWKHQMLPLMQSDDPWAALLRYYNEIDRNWMCANVGAKWSFVEYSDEECFELCSAWSHPSEGVCAIARRLGKEAGPEFTLSVMYSDEMPNFFGCEIIDGYGTILDDIEWSDQDLIDYMLENVEGLAAEYKDDDFTEAGWNIYNDHCWECVHALQEKWFKNCEEAEDE